MPAISTLTLCEHTPGTNQFTSMATTYVAVDPPSWFSMGPPQIDEFTGLATYTYQVLNTAPIGGGVINLNSGGQYIIIYINDSCTIYLDTCIWVSGSEGPIPPPPDAESWDVYGGDGSYGTLIFWDNETQTLSWLFTKPGTHWITLQSQGDPTVFLVYEFIISACGITDDTCQANPLMIVWLNQDGGYNSYIFNAKKTYNVDIGGSTTYKDSNLITRYVQFDNIFDGVVQPSGYIPESHVDLLKGLKYSLQAWVAFDYGTEDQASLEIFNYAKSFKLKDQGTGFFKYDFDFNYAAELLTQTL